MELSDYLHSLKQTKPPLTKTQTELIELINGKPTPMISTTLPETKEATSRHNLASYIKAMRSFSSNNETDSPKQNVNDDNKLPRYTCLVAGCHMLFKTFDDFTLHYLKHGYYPSAVKICADCFVVYRLDLNHCCIKIEMKCYECCLTFENMSELAFHNMMKHQLVKNYGNDFIINLLTMENHFKTFRKNYFQNGQESNKPMKNKEILAHRSIMRHKRKKYRMQNKLCGWFTCLKPKCNKIFQNFNTFKSHHLKHFNIKNKIMCWRCYKPFSNPTLLKFHQKINNCHHNVLFKCYKCSLVFWSIKRLSIHKVVAHNADKIMKFKEDSKRTKKTTYPDVSKREADIIHFKNYLTRCNNQMIQDTKNNYV